MHLSQYGYMLKVSAVLAADLKPFPECMIVSAGLGIIQIA